MTNASIPLPKSAPYNHSGDSDYLPEDDDGSALSLIYFVLNNIIQDISWMLEDLVNFDPNVMIESSWTAIAVLLALCWVNSFYKGDLKRMKSLAISTVIECNPTVFMCFIFPTLLGGMMVPVMSKVIIDIFFAGEGTEVLAKLVNTVVLGNAYHDFSHFSSHILDEFFESSQEVGLGVRISMIIQILQTETHGVFLLIFALLPLFCVWGVTMGIIMVALFDSTKYHSEHMMGTYIMTVSGLLLVILAYLKDEKYYDHESHQLLPLSIDRQLDADSRLSNTFFELAMFLIALCCAYCGKFYKDNCGGRDLKKPFDSKQLAGAIIMAGGQVWLFGLTAKMTLKL